MSLSQYSEQDSRIIKDISSKTGDAMWREIDDLVKRWALKNPFGANWNRIYNQQKRDSLLDPKFAKSHDKKTGITNRTTIAIHPELMNYIETFYPKFFASKSNIRRFGNTYQMFKIPKEY